MNESEARQSLVYTVYDIQILLKIGRNSAYKLIEDAEFPVIRAGKNIRIPKEGFDKWLMQQ